MPIMKRLLSHDTCGWDYSDIRKVIVATNDHYVAFALKDKVLVFSLSTDDPTSLTLDFSLDNTNSQVSAMLWLPSHLLVIGFESGILMGFNLEGKCDFEHQFHSSSICSIQFHAKSKFIWILQADGFLIGVSYCFCLY